MQIRPSQQECKICNKSLSKAQQFIESSSMSLNASLYLSTRSLSFDYNNQTNEPIYCQPCCQINNNRLKSIQQNVRKYSMSEQFDIHKEIQSYEGMLENSYNELHNLNGYKLQNIDEADLDNQLKILAQRQNKLQAELQHYTKEIEQHQKYSKHQIQQYLQNDNKQIKSAYENSCALQFQQHKREQTTQTLQFLRRVNILQQFFQLEVSQGHSKMCKIDGVHLTFDNLYLILPVCGFILVYLLPDKYERKCISQIYVDQKLIIVFQVKNGKKSIDREVSALDNGKNWIHFLNQQMQQLSKCLKIKQKNTQNENQSKNTEKQLIFNLCSILKLILQ